MRVLLWHVHGSYTTSLVQGSHEYLLPVLPDRGADGRGRALTWDWPANVHELRPDELAEAEIDVVILQRRHELDSLCEDWAGRRPGRDLPAVYLEHNAPQGRIADMRHPVADRPELTLVHVTHFNDLFWDAGATPTTVVEHGVVDPGPRYTGRLERVIVAINEPVRRGRVTGTDLLQRLGREVPIDLFGMGCAELGGHEDPPQHVLHAEMARRRVYLHPIRWTSLGLSLLEAMHLGMPIVALGTTEVGEAVPPDAGVVSTDVETLVRAMRELLADPERARECGLRAREAALRRYGLGRFLDDWDALLERVVAEAPRRAAA